MFLVDQRKRCVRMFLKQTSIVNYNVQGAPEFWFIRPTSAPLQTNRQEMFSHAPYTYFCCDECDEPIQVGAIQNTIEQTGDASDIINVACKKSVLGIKLECQCDSENDATPSTCPIGTYLGGCTQQNGVYRCIPCTNVDGDVATFLSAGGLRLNNCMFECRPVCVDNHLICLHMCMCSVFTCMDATCRGTTTIGH